MSETYTAVLDRIVDDRAVLLLEADGAVVEERALGVASLPEAGRHEGAVFTVTLADDSLEEVTYRERETRDRRERARNRFDRLSERLPDE